MTPPYRVGDQIAWIDADDAGVRVSRATVLTVERGQQGWSVETARGRESVDQRGEGSRVVPIDDELERDFEVRGESFIVQSTVQEITQHLDSTSSGRTCNAPSIVTIWTAATDTTDDGPA